MTGMLCRGRATPVKLALLGALLVQSAGRCGGAPVGKPELLVVVRMGTGAYQQAVDAFRAAIAESAAADVTVLDLAGKDSGPALAGKLNSGSARVVVSVGPEALEALASGTGKAPLISTLLVQSDATRGPGASARAGPLATLSLDVPFEAVLGEVRRAFPGKTRVGVVRNPVKNGPTEASLKAAAQQAGFTIHIVECSRPAQLIESFLSLKNQVDFVWCLPDSDLYTSATVKPLLLASLGNRLPIIGFSESFVQAGAAIGVYPDFGAAGRQTAELVQKWLSGATLAPAERLKSVRASINTQVTRLLGLRPEAAYPAGNHAVYLP
jgi:ABC-type uncharacterized transport system substrate-binding protein